MIDALIEAIVLLLKLEASAMALEIAFLMAVPGLTIVAALLSVVFAPNDIPPSKNVVIRELTMKDRRVEKGLSTEPR